MSANIENSSSAAAAATPADASASGAVAGGLTGACAPGGTLHDFVSNLITDEVAKAAYLADPLAALSSAGLGDLTPADVQEVLPLVADSLPTDLTSLPVGDLPVGDLPVDLPALGSLPVVGDLSALGDLPVSLPTGLPNLGDLPVTLPTGLPDLGHLPSLPTFDTPFGDVTAVVSNAAAAVDLNGDVADVAASGLLSNPVDSDAPTVSTAVSSAFGDLAAGGKLDPHEFGGSVAGSTPFADFGGGLVGHVGGDLGAWAATDTVGGDLAAGAIAGPEGVQVAAESPLGDVHLNSNGDFSIQPVDTADLLDVDHLGSTGDAVAGTVAHYVGTGADVLAGGVAAGGAGLGGYLTGSLTSVSGTVEHATDTVSEGIHQGGDTLSEHLTNLP
ncbi:IniB N-terminal domain-containing protein, partial [Actinophytocola sp.]|uniref:IniB N-terminal domain-containing protein n=1 Tax=Actinophytocola sp. TaxID=1872138 RepID=UPI003899837D